MSSKLKPEKTFAILMGCSRFDAGFPPIPPVERNLSDLQSLLTDTNIIGLHPDNIRVIQNEMSSKAIKLLKQYADEAKSAKATTLLFYYAGHGYRRTDGKYFLTATDSDTELINFNGTTGISFDDAIEKVLKQSKIHQHIVILDACSSGTAAQSDTDGLPEIDLRGSYTLTSSADRENSLFDEALRPHTFFTAELIDALSKGIANEKESITLTELYDDLKLRMKTQGYAMSPRQRTTNELQAHTYAFCKNKAFDKEKKQMEELAHEIEEALEDLEKGAIRKAKRNLIGILEEIEEKITREDYKSPLFVKVQGYLSFCEHYFSYKPIYEKILSSNTQADELALVQAEVQRHKTTITELKAELQELQKMLAMAHYTQEDAQATIETMKRELADKRALIKANKEELVRLQNNASIAAANAKELHTQIANLKTELAAAQKQLKAIRTQQEAPKSATLKDDLVYIKGGTFDMGDVLNDNEYDNETVHRVTLNDFYLGQYAVTFEEYDRYCAATQRDKPSDSGWGRGPSPVINISWYDAVEYCNWLSAQHNLTPYYAIGKTGKDTNNTNDSDNVKWTVSPNRSANGYRLPTEAEWEYAAREGGKEVRFGNGKDVIDPKDINFDARESYKKPYSVLGEFRQKTVPVGSLNSSNALGLHDMSGNVWEWCWDWYNSYPTGEQNNPQGADKGTDRVVRGGGWNSSPRICRAADRFGNTPAGRTGDLGFRLARS